MQPPHNTPMRLPEHSEFAFLLYARGGGNGHVEDPLQLQYPGGHRLAGVRGPFVIESEFENAAQNPLVTFTDLVQEEIPKGQLVVAEGKGMH